MDSEQAPRSGSNVSISADDSAEFSDGVGGREPMMLRLLGKWLSSGALGRRLSIALMIAAALAGAATFFAITNVSRFGVTQETVLVLIFVDLALVLLLGVTIAWVLVRLWTQRRAGSVGARLHIKLVSLFALVAFLPAIIVVILAALIFNTQVQAWFNDRVRTAVENSVLVADAYLTEHKRAISADATAMADDLNRSWSRFSADLPRMQRTVEIQAAIRSLPEAIVFDSTGRIIARAGLTAALEIEQPPASAIEQAESGDIVILTSESGDRVRALVRLDISPRAYLYAGRFIDPNVLRYVGRTRQAAQAYGEREALRTSLLLQFATIFVIVTLLLLLIAVGVGLGFANQMTRPIARLVRGAELVRSGNLGVRIEGDEGTDEFGMLTRAFNRMTRQLDEQRSELIEANRQLEDRRRFTEAVLAGVSAGVVGLDREGRINLPNRSATALLNAEIGDLAGRLLADAVPEMASTIARAVANPDRLVEDDVALNIGDESRTLHVRIAAERDNRNQVIGFVATFDDMTELLSAQRKAAWADVARRIAHEIKNPLTPIQLSAERLRRKYGDEITSDRETFEQCTETIVRQVSDIGRMVDEFSAFARMPNPVIADANLVAICRNAVILQQTAHPDIQIDTMFPRDVVTVACDGGLLAQALTNLLRNAIEAIEGRTEPSYGAALPDGVISVSLEVGDEMVQIVVEDNGRGLPETQRDRLTEPYITTRAKGTGLGLAIVKRVMEQHGGDLHLDDRVKKNTDIASILSYSRGASVSLVLPIKTESAEAAGDQLPASTALAGG